MRTRLALFLSLDLQHPKSSIQLAALVPLFALSTFNRPPQLRHTHHQPPCRLTRHTATLSPTPLDSPYRSAANAAHPSCSTTAQTRLYVERFGWVMCGEQRRGGEWCAMPRSAPPRCVPPPNPTRRAGHRTGHRTAHLPKPLKHGMAWHTARLHPA